MSHSISRLLIALRCNHLQKTSQNSHSTLVVSSGLSLPFTYNRTLTLEAAWSALVVAIATIATAAVAAVMEVTLAYLTNSHPATASRLTCMTRIHQVMAAPRVFRRGILMIPSSMITLPTCTGQPLVCTSGLGAMVVVLGCMIRRIDNTEVGLRCMIGPRGPLEPFLGIELGPILGLQVWDTQIIPGNADCIF